VRAGAKRRFRTCALPSITPSRVSKLPETCARTSESKRELESVHEARTKRTREREVARTVRTTSSLFANRSLAKMDNARLVGS